MGSNTFGGLSERGDEPFILSISFLENYIEFVDFQWASTQVPKISYPHFMYETKPDFHWREGVVPTKISKGLYFTGKENFPYLGLEGEILSGLMVGRIILQKSH